MARRKACAAPRPDFRRARKSSGGTPQASFPRRSPRPAARSGRAERARASRAGAGAAPSPSIQTSVRRLAGGRSELVGPLAPAFFLFGVELARAFLGAPIGRRIAIRAHPDDQPDENDEK